jgi:parvulin-like peptidyl-prolyl isomerase
MVMFANLSIEPEAIVDFLKHEVHLKEICQRIAYQHIVHQTTQARGIVVTPEEIQQEADSQRYQKRLESATETFSWLEEQMITPNDWEDGIRERLLSQKLAVALFDHEVEQYFVEHRLDFEQVILYRIQVPYQQLAQELFYQIEEGEISFFEAAHLYDTDEARRFQCGYEGKIYRWNLQPTIAALVFGARLGELIGPIENEQHYDLLRVEEIIAAELTPEIRQGIIDRMFQDWLNRELNYLIHNS